MAKSGARGRETALDSLIRATSHWPVQRLHFLARDLGEPLANVAYRRELVLANLARAFPEADAGALARGFYAAFAQVCLETLRTLAMPPAELRERVGFTGAQALNDGPAVLLMAHHGNLVWAVNALAMEISSPVSVVYKTPHIAAMRQMLLDIAARFGVDAVSVKDVRRQLVKRRQEGRGRVWTLVADQRPGRDRHMAELCGLPTAFFAGPERIARTFDWPVYYLSCRRVAPGCYACSVEKIAEPPYAAVGVVTERYAAKLQADIDDAPEDWLWSHDRWRNR